MNKKILIVEDDEFLLGLEAKKLTMLGYVVSSAQSAEDAEMMLEKEIPDLILLDLLLPKTYGLDFLVKLKQNVKLNHVPVIVFSNVADQEEMKKALTLGASDYMIKSNFTLEEMESHIKLVLNK